MEIITKEDWSDDIPENVVDTEDIIKNQYALSVQRNLEKLEEEINTETKFEWNWTVLPVLWHNIW